MTVYQDGIAAIGASKALCKNIYLRSKSLTYYDGFGDLGESYKRATLVHEFVHTYQGKTIYGCVDLGVSSLYHQFMSYLRYGSRSYAYVYSPNLSHNVFKENAKDGYNVEQEASIVEDYFFVYYLNESVSHTNCYDCNRTKCYSCTDLHSKEFIVEWLEKESQRILQKYA